MPHSSLMKCPIKSIPHALKKEIYQKALKNGVTDIVCTPEMPEFSGKLMKKIEHCYNIGAGSITMEKLRKIFGKMDRKDKDYKKLERFL